MRTPQIVTGLAAMLAAPILLADVQLGPRPFYLIDDMDDGWLKSTLAACREMPMTKSDFSIGHRGAALQFPEHTKESYIAAARMGAGIIECDVTFTKDRQLVCRHSQCDLHTTTDILARPELAAKCAEPFVPAALDEKGNFTRFASAKCCTSDITLAEFKTLCGKMDASNPYAFNVQQYLGGTPNFRTDLYSTCGTVLSHKESIELIAGLGAKFTPELKSASVPMPYQGVYTQEAYAQQMINEYKTLGVRPEQVFPQSFNLNDVRYWLRAEPAFGRQAVYLDDRDSTLPGFNTADPKTWQPSMRELANMGVKIIGPPMWMLVSLDGNNQIVPSAYARAAKDAGLDIIAWTIERSGFLKNGGGWYYQTVSKAINNDGDMYQLLDVLAWDVGIKGIFSDWPATVTYYANCMGE